MSSTSWRWGSNDLPRRDRSSGISNTDTVNTELPHYRALIESALVYAGQTFTFEDVVKEVEEGKAQFWPGPNSVIVTQVETTPQVKVLRVFLAAGNIVELEAMTPGIEEWAVEQGCTVARLVGRKGWKRSWLMGQGWSDTDLVILEKNLDAGR